ncbi:nucleoside hydrolase [Pseudalkalibacillus caeni]|uniref:Nucleoside hydrolase n=1 Tax=Exobacillus caeni TaxID=2574798 RepID=A0A5R9F1P5_9BACL|nr:nucleoside hydrolase [Pseudalkalibacillus caeni]TLS35368.1 nucleoside hydrolase [Pseudalkalibacillus caeni]
MKVLLFSDPGIDETVAILYALLHPFIEVVGIVTGYGNVTREQAIRNGRYLLTLTGNEDIPLIAGAEGPLTGETAPYYPAIHGPEGLGPINPPESISAEFVNFDEVFKIIDQFQDDLVIVTLGRLTDLAIAFLLGEKSLKEVKAFYIMGGAFLVPGNVTAVAEANFHGDPLAADIVMEKATNVYVIPLNVTTQALITPSIIQTVYKSQQNEFGKLLVEVFDYYMKAYKKLVPGINGAYFHDLLTVSALGNPSLLGYVERNVRVDHGTGLARGQSIADFRPKPELSSSEKREQIALQLDYQSFVYDFIRIMTGPVSSSS